MDLSGRRTHVLPDARGTSLGVIGRKVKADDETPRARRISEPITKWGMIHAWKAMRFGRFVHLDVTDEGIVVTVGDGASEPLSELVKLNDDPSAVVQRLISRVGIG